MPFGAAVGFPPIFFPLPFPSFAPRPALRWSLRPSAARQQKSPCGHDVRGVKYAVQEAELRHGSHNVLSRMRGRAQSSSRLSGGRSTTRQRTGGGGGGSGGGRARARTRTNTRDGRRVLSTAAGNRCRRRHRFLSPLRASRTSRPAGVSPPPHRRSRPRFPVPIHRHRHVGPSRRLGLAAFMFR